MMGLKAICCQVLSARKYSFVYILYIVYRLKSSTMHVLQRGRKDPKVALILIFYNSITDATYLPPSVLNLGCLWAKKIEGAYHYR